MASGSRGTRSQGNPNKRRQTTRDSSETEEEPIINVLPRAMRSSLRAPKPCTHVSFFINHQHNKKFIDVCSMKNVLSERKFCMTLLRKIGWIYLDRLTEWGWMDMVGNLAPTYPDITRVFYFCGDNRVWENGVPLEKTKVNNEFVTSVRGTRMVINADFIARFLTNPRCNQGDIGRIHSVVEACRIVYRDDELIACKNSVTSLTIHERILHFMVSQVFMPKGGSKGDVTQQEVCFMARIMVNDPPNLCLHIATRMVEALDLAHGDSNKGSLPYSRLIARICEVHCPTMHANDVVNNSTEMGILNENALKEMGWVENEETGEWRFFPKKNRPRNANVVIQEEAQAQEEEEVQGDGGGAIDLNTLRDEIAQMHTTVRDSYFATMVELDQHGQRQVHIHEDLRAIREHLNLGQSDLPFPYPTSPYPHFPFPHNP